MNCERCQNEQGAPCIPYIAHEAEMARMERINRRLVFVAALEAVVFVLLLFMSIAVSSL